MGILRILLAISVLCAHIHGKAILGFRFLNGDLAVQCFYMISGFYMALVLNQKYKPGQYGVFISQRYLRLWPTYILIAILTLLGQMWVQPDDPNVWRVWSTYGGLMHPFTRLVLIGSNLLILGQDWTNFFAVNPVSGAAYWTAHWKTEPISAPQFLVIGQAWTLGVELSFYLFAPWLVRQRYRVQAAILALSLAARCVGYAFGLEGDPWNYRFFPFELAFFMAGSLAYQNYARFPEVMAKYSPAMAKWGRWVCYALIVAFSRLPAHAERYYVMVVLLFLVLPVLFYTTQNTAWDRTIGELSYPFYLGHVLIVEMLQPCVAHLPKNTWGVIFLFATLAFSYAVYRGFEAPIENWRHRLVKQKLSVPRIR